MLAIRYYLPGKQNAIEIRGRSDSCLGSVNRRVLLTTFVVVTAAVAAVVIAVAVAVAAVVIARAVALLHPFAVALVGFMPADHAADTGPEEAVVTRKVAGDAAPIAAPLRQPLACAGAAAVPATSASARPAGIKSDFIVGISSVW